MSLSIQFVKKGVGNFFGTNRASSEQWKKAAEKQIKDGDFGLSISQSMYGHTHQTGSTGFLQGAEKILSKIEAFQKIEESQEKEQRNKINANSEISDDTAVCNDDIECPLSLTTPSKVQTLSKQSVFNSAYLDDDDDDDIDSGDVDGGANQSTKVPDKPESHRRVQFEVPTCLARTKYGITSEGNLLGPKLKKKSNRPTSSEPEIVAHKRALKMASEMNQAQESKTPFEKAKIIFFDEYLKLKNHLNKESNVDNAEKVRMTKSCDLLNDKLGGTGTSKDSISIQLDLSDSDVIGKDKDLQDDQKTSASTSGMLNKDTRVKELNRKPKIPKMDPKDLAHGKEAIEQYLIYKKYEQKDKLWKVEYEMNKKLREYDWKLKAVDDLIAMARDFYMNPQTNNAAKWRELKTNVRRNSCHINRTEVRRKLGTLPEYKPFFTCFIIITQLISFIVTCAFGGFTYIGLEPKLTLESDIQTFMGLETIDRWTPPNVWIGPSDRDLIGMGAFFAPCMRSDMKIQLEFSQKNYSIDETLGCCEVASRNVAGTTTQSECGSLSEGVGNWRSGVMCSERSADQSSVRHSMKPCCVGLKGQCRLLSHKHCVFLSGVYHLHGPDHCSQVNCLQEVCKLGNLESTKSQPWQPKDPHQWWRLPLSLFYHHGIIHVLLVSVVQWFLFKSIEHTAGWLRMMVVYFVTGSAALLMSAIFSPYQGHVGGVGAICGMIGLVFVELAQFWTLVQRPLIELGKLFAVIILLLFTGTLPYLDVFGMIIGLVLGVLCGVLVLPFVTFGKWHAHVRVILVLVSFSLLFVAYVMLLHVFINVQSIGNCKTCELLNCVPYTTKMCETSYWEQL